MTDPDVQQQARDAGHKAGDTEFLCCDCVHRSIVLAARQQGRREGIEQAAKVIETVGADSYNWRLMCFNAIRALLERDGEA